MQIWKRYKESAGWAAWEKTTKEEAVKHTEEAGYWKPGTVLLMLSQGSIINTPWAQYTATNGDQPPVD